MPALAGAGTASPYRQPGWLCRLVVPPLPSAHACLPAPCRQLADTAHAIGCWPLSRCSATLTWPQAPASRAPQRRPPALATFCPQPASDFWSSGRAPCLRAGCGQQQRTSDEGACHVHTCSAMLPCLLTLRRTRICFSVHLGSDCEVWARHCQARRLRGAARLFNPSAFIAALTPHAFSLASFIQFLPVPLQCRFITLPSAPDHPRRVCAFDPVCCTSPLIQPGCLGSSLTQAVLPIFSGPLRPACPKRHGLPGRQLHLPTKFWAQRRP